MGDYFWKLTSLLPKRPGRSILPYVGIAISSWIFYKLFIKPFLSPLRKVPGTTYKPIVGNMMEALKAEPNSNTIRWMKALNSRFIRFYFMYGEERLLAADPDVVKYICVTNSKNYDHSGSLSGTLGMSEFLLNLNGEAHHRLKLLLNPAFNKPSINGYVPIFDKVTQEAVRQWQAKLAVSEGTECIVPAQSHMAYITLDGICECAFDYHLNCVKDPEGAHVVAYRTVLNGFVLRLLDMIPLLSWFPSKEKRQYEEALDIFTSTIKKVIEEKRQKMMTGKDDHSSDLLSRLMAARDEDGRGLDDHSIFSQVGGFFVAGFDTTSTSLTWALLLMAEHPDTQEKARQEVMSLTSKDQPITAEAVQQLTYVGCVFKEALRLHPPAPVHFRRAVKADVINGYTIPAGTKIGICSGALHRMPENWEYPDSFKPERFLKTHNPFSFLPFSAGPYMCIGHYFALTEAKVVLARLLQHFRWKLPAGYTYRRVRRLTVQPHPALSLVISPV